MVFTPSPLGLVPQTFTWVWSIRLANCNWCISLLYTLRPYIRYKLTLKRMPTRAAGNLKVTRQSLTTTTFSRSPTILLTTRCPPLSFPVRMTGTSRAVQQKGVRLVAPPPPCVSGLYTPLAGGRGIRKATPSRWSPLAPSRPLALLASGSFQGEPDVPTVCDDGSGNGDGDVSGG